jgi:hypothetical protein
MIDGHTPIQKIIESVVATYQVNIDDAHQDVTEFLTALETAGLIHTSHSSEG